MTQEKKKTPPKRETRTIRLDRATAKPDARTVDLSFSSELPYVRWWGIEILDHSPGAMRMGRAKNGISLLFNHDRNTHLGKMEDVVCGDDRMGRGTARFGRSSFASEKWQDVEDGILTDVSVGYEVHFAKEIPAKELPKDLMELATKEKLPVYRITDWEPFECSLVTVAADPTVGVGRTEEPVKGQEEGITGAPQPIIKIKEERKMDENKGKTFSEFKDELEREKAEAGKSATAKENERIAEINKIYKRFSRNIPEMIWDKAVKTGTSVEEFLRVALDYSGNSKPIDTPISDLDLSPRDRKRYSITRAMLAGVQDSTVDSSFERACHEELVKRGLGTGKGILVPYDVMGQPADARGTRGKWEQRTDLIAGTGSLGGFLVGTDNLGGEFIDLLRNNMLIRKLGARVLSGLKGNVTIPKRTAGVVSYWVGEATAPTEGANTFAQLSLSPKNVGANLDYTRNLLLQSNPSIDALVNGDLALSLATAIDLAAFHGTGGGGQPQGIVGSSGVGSVTCTSIGTGTLGKILEFQTDIAANNALAGNCAYVTTPAVAAILKAQVLYASTASPAWEGGILSGQMVGFPAWTSNQITAGYMIFGDFSQVILAEWGSLELVVDPYTQSKNGIIQVTAFQTVDVGVRYGGAFSVTTSVAT